MKTATAPEVQTSTPTSLTVTVDALNKNVAPKNCSFVDPRKIVIIPGFNIRKNYEEIDELADSIAENGVVVPILVQKQKLKKGDVLIDGSILSEDCDGYATRNGHRRRLALINLLNRETPIVIDRVPIIISDGKSKEDALDEQYITNTGKPYTNMENAEVFGQKHRIFKKTPKEIAKKYGIKSVSIVYTGIEMSTAPDYVKELIHNNTISYNAVYNIYNNVYSRNWEETEKHIRNIVDGALEKVAQTIPELAQTIDKDTKEAAQVSETQQVTEMPSGDDQPVIVSPTGMTVNLNDVAINDDDKDSDSSTKKPEGSGRHNNQKVNKAPKPVVSKEVKAKVSKIASDAVRKEVKHSMGGTNLKGSQPVINPDDAKASKTRIHFLIQKIKDSKLPTDNKMFMLLEALAQKEGDYKVGDAFDIYNQFIGN